MTYVFYDRSGLATRWPCSLAASKRLRKRLYHCPSGYCRQGCHSFNINSRGSDVRYTANSACVLCSELDAGDFYNVVLGTARLEKDRVSPCCRNLKPYRSLSPEKLDMFREALEILEKDRTLRVRPEPCRTKGHLGIRTGDNKCYYCVLASGRPSPRQEAIARGDRWYNPEASCVKCGTESPRRVSNGACRGCQSKPTPPPPSSQLEPLEKHYPDLILQKEAARLMGFKVYRTGRPCNRGHMGYRYVSNGSCVNCSKKA